MPFIPVLWAAGIVVGSLWTTRQVAKTVLYTAMGAEALALWLKNKMLSKSMRLGLNPTRPDFTEERIKRAQEEMRRMYGEAAAQMAVAVLERRGKQPEEHQRFVRFEMKKKDLPSHLNWLSGTYVLSAEEHKQLEAAIHRLDILHGDGLTSKKAKNFCKKYRIPPEEFAAFWTDLGIDVMWLREVSKRRLEDTEFMAFLESGAPQFH